MHNFGGKLCHFDKCGRIARPPSSCPSRTYVRLRQLLYNFVHATYKICACDLLNLCIRPSKFCIRHTKVASNLNYKTCSVSDLQNLCIRPTYTVVYQIYENLCIWPTKVVHPTYVCNRNIDPYGSTANYIQWLYLHYAVPARSDKQNRMYIRPTAVVGPKYRRTETP